MIVHSMLGSLKQKKMEIPAIFFYGVWCAICVIFSFFGLDVERRTFSDSVPPIAIFVFESIFIVSLCRNLLIYSLALNPGLDLFTGMFEDKMLRVTDPTEKSIFIFNKSKVRKWIDFAVGTAGTIVFQNFYRITSFHQVVPFIYLAVAWLANTVLLGVSHDLGFLDFLLGNVIVGCTVSEYWLRGTTWVAYGAAVVLHGLRVMIESVELVHREGEGFRVVIW